MDLSAERVAAARQAVPDATFWIREGDTLPFPDRSVQLVMLSTVLSSILDSGTRRQVTAEAYRVLVPDAGQRPAASQPLPVGRDQAMISSVRRAIAGLAVLAIAGCSGNPASTSWSVTTLHYTPNDNFGSSGQYLPGSDGFNLADSASFAGPGTGMPRE